MTSILTYLLNLNFFQPSDPTEKQDEHEHHSSIIATRVYIIIFLITLVTLILALWLTPQTTKVILQYPTQDQFQALPLDAQCPCSQISLSYGQFVSIHAKFHQVCSSDFISDRWIKAIFSGLNSIYFYRADFRTIGSAQFRALANLCYLTRASVLQSLASFNTMLMISPYVLSQSVVQSQARSSINQFQLTTADTFVKQLEFVRKMIIGNQLLSALETNILPLYAEIFNDSLQMGYYMIYNILNQSYCNCQIDVNCRIPSMIFKETEQTFAEIILSNDRSMLMNVDGFSAGCMPMDSILQSTLECFYRQSCLEELLSFFPTNETFTAMNVSIPTHFKPTSTIEVIVDELMVEEWMTNISYEMYYTQCAPVVCTYLKVERHDYLYVLTKVIGSLGGLTLTLNFIVPTLVDFVRRKKKVATPSISLYTRICQLQAAITTFLTQLNIFKRNSSSIRQIHYQRFATRFYIIIFLILLITLTTYTFSTDEIYRETILHPTEDHFNKLQQIYPNTLSCPCSVISVPYTTFINIDPIYHQVCSSDMVSQRWINYYNSFTLYFFTSYFEFRANAGSQFRILATLCEQAQQTVNNTLQLFLQRQIVGSQIISQELFKSQINESIEEWKLNTLNSYLRPVQLIRVTNQGNQLINSFHNFHFRFDKTSTELIPVPANYSTCSCAKSNSCRTPMGIYTYNWTALGYIELFRIPNFFSGCFPVESLLESTLECFYDRQCMNTIQSYMTNTTPYFSPLNATFNVPNETIQSIIDRLMINSWLSNVSFSAYYKMCAPISCTFEYTRQHDIFYLISSILGIFAGLLFGIKILILISLRFIEKMIEDLSLKGLGNRFKSLFICRNEQQITDRFHFILLISTVFLFYLISTLTLITKTEQIMKPSPSTYQDLLVDYQNSLQCPCLHISIEYQSFLTIVPRMHPICSSVFVSDDWIDYIFNNNDPLLLNYTDFRTTAAGQFQLLASLCQLSEQVVDDALLNLATSNFINSQLLSSDLLDERIRALVNEVRMTIPNSFLNSLSLIRQTTEANMLMNMFATNWKFQYEIVLTIFFIFYTAPLDYQECSCGVSSKCVQSSQGMLAGCYPLEALLQSSFQCFYNQTCIDPTQTFRALNTSSNISSQYSTIESILNKLMVEDYSVNISYENYFSRCQPTSCSYSYVGHNNILDVTLTVIGLYGGLTIIARFLVELFLKLCICRNVKVSPWTMEESE